MKKLSILFCLLLGGCFTPPQDQQVTNALITRLERLERQRVDAYKPVLTQNVTYVASPTVTTQIITQVKKELPQRIWIDIYDTTKNSNPYSTNVNKIALEVIYEDGKFYIPPERINRKFIIDMGTSTNE